MKQKSAGRVSTSEQTIRDIKRKMRKQYNEERPHSSLGQISPAMFRRQVENAENSNLELSH